MDDHSLTHDDMPRVNPSMVSAFRNKIDGVSLRYLKNIDMRGDIEKAADDVRAYRAAFKKGAKPVAGMYIEGETGIEIISLSNVEGKREA